MKERSKRILKVSSAVIVSLIAFFLLAVGAAVLFVFTPSRLTPAVTAVAENCLDAEVDLKSVELTFFSTFPRFGVKIKNGTVSVPGGDSIPDTERTVLLKFNRAVAEVDVMRWLKNRELAVTRLRLGGAVINACRDSLGVANWDIARTSSDTPDSADLPAVNPVDSVDGKSVSFMPESIEVRRLVIKNARLCFDDRFAGMRVSVDTLNMKMGISLSKEKGAVLDVDATMDSVVFENGGESIAGGVDMWLKSSLVADRASRTVRVEKASMGINDVNLDISGTVARDTSVNVVDIDLDFRSDVGSVAGLMELIPVSVLDRTGFEADGRIVAGGKVRGLYGKDNMPALEAFARIEDASARYDGFPAGIDNLVLDIYAFLDRSRPDSSFVDLRTLDVRGTNMEINASANVTDMFSDPVLDFSMKADVDMDSVYRAFPFRKGLEMGGKLNADFSGVLRRSWIENGDYAMIQAKGMLEIDSLYFRDSSTGSVFDSDMKLRFSGKKLLGVSAEVNRLKFDGMGMAADADRLKVRVLSERTSGKTDVFAVGADMDMKAVSVRIGDSVDVFCASGKGAVKYLPKGNRKSPLPSVSLKLDADSMMMRTRDAHMGMKKGKVSLSADMSADSVWKPSGRVAFTRLVAKVPQYALPLRFNRTVVKMGAGRIDLDKANIRVGRSNLQVTGYMKNLYGAISEGERMEGRLDIKSRNINMNQLMRAYSEPEAVESEIVSDTVSSAATLVKIPSNLDLVLTADVGKVVFGKMKFEDIRGNVEVRDGYVYLENLELKSAGADMQASMIYSAPDARSAYAGFNLGIRDIDVAEFIRMVPSIDTMVPMLQSFRGVINADMAAETVLDSAFNIDIPTLKAAVKVRGDSLVLMDGKTFAEISKKLMFTNRKENVFDSIAVNITVEDGNVNIFPFIVEIDRYRAAAGGVQYMDMSFDYHISILKSPLPFKAGVNIRGTLDDMKFGIGRAKYRNEVTPVRIRQMDSVRINLAEEIVSGFRSVSERGKWRRRAVEMLEKDWSGESRKSMELLKKNMMSEEDSVYTVPSAGHTVYGNDSLRKNTLPVAIGTVRGK